MTINIFMHIYIGENAHWDIYAPPLAKSLQKFFFSNFFLHFRCILLQINHKKCFYISISILGPSGVNTFMTTVSIICICICTSSKLHLSLRSILAAGALSSYMKARLELDHVISDLICTD